jgi:LuxR family maltose regulon positive regulatory protein
LGYFLGVIETIFPGSVEETQSFLTGVPQPPTTAITNTLINELNQIEEPFILVLDDYHLIEAQAIHDLLNEILTHPPRNLHLVLGTRMDPLLPLVTLRPRSKPCSQIGSTPSSLRTLTPMITTSATAMTISPQPLAAQ